MQPSIELDFEAEEAAILGATDRLPMQLFVEESGCAEFLKDRLVQEGPFEAVHLSCHGDIDPDTGPILLLETPEGRKASCSPGALSSTIGENKLPLVFLSACRTAELRNSNHTDGGHVAIESNVRSLVRVLFVTLFALRFPDYFDIGSNQESMNIQGYKGSNCWDNRTVIVFIALYIHAFMFISVVR